MIIHKYKCIFVHCQKCAGEAIEFSLSGKSDRGYRGDMYEGSPEKHFSVNQYIERHGESIWRNYFTFSFVRNPWSRVISWIRYRDKRYNLYNDEINTTIIKRELERHHLASNSYFELLSLNTPDSIDFIGRFETLQEDFNTICDKIGIPQQKLPHINKSKHKHYTEYYDEETKQIVAEKYAKDIEYFGYEFK
jgi:hypothetical protein